MLVFHSDREGRNHLFTLALPGGRVGQLTAGRDHHDEEAAVSPDGRHIAFVTTRFDSRTWDVAVMDRAAGAVRRLTTHVAFERHPVFAATGTEVLFSSDQNGTQAVFRAPLDGGNVARVSPPPERALMASVAPDGRWLAYIGGTPDGLRVFVHDRASGERRPVTPAGTDAAWPRWSPDGTRIAYTEFAPGGASSLAIMSLGSDSIERFAIAGMAAVREPSWSADGRRLAAAGTRALGAGEDWDLLLIDPASRSAFQLTGGRDHDRAPAWSPR